MTSIESLLFLVLACSALAQKGQDAIVETRNAPMGTTIFTPKSVHEVESTGRLFIYKMKLTPLVSQNLDGTDRKMGILVAVTYSQRDVRFTDAAVVFVVDGRPSEQIQLQWSIDSSRGTGGMFEAGVVETTIQDQAGFVHKLAVARGASLSILIPGRPRPLDQTSFKLSREQLKDCRLMADKYDALGR